MEHQISHSDFTKAEAERVRNLYDVNQIFLEEYIDRLLWWNKKINLVSRDVSRETITEHVVHSLAISESALFKNAKKIIDAGTGGGLPGIPLAGVHLEKKVVLNDVVAKKIIACKQIAGELKQKNIETQSTSIAKVNFTEGDVIVSKHAFKINDLLGMIREKPWKGIILLKGLKEGEEELAGIGEELRINITALEPGFQNSFYEGKAMVEITRRK